jgi:SAM-dependent methyltransferase
VSSATETFWDRRSGKYDAGIRKHDAGYEKTLDKTRSLLNHSDVVLDLGCASGEIGLDLAPSVRRIRGIDPAAKMIELARLKAVERQIDNIAFECADAFDPRLGKGSFTAVVAFNVFHLLDDVPAVLARLHELLSPGGLLISKTPCLGGWNPLLRGLIRFAQKVGWAPAIRAFRPPGLEALVARDFEIVESTIWEAKSKTQWIVARKRP